MAELLNDEAIRRIPGTTDLQREGMVAPTTQGGERLGVGDSTQNGVG